MFPLVKVAFDKVCREGKFSTDSKNPVLLTSQPLCTLGVIIAETLVSHMINFVIWVSFHYYIHIANKCRKPIRKMKRSWKPCVVVFSAAGLATGSLSTFVYTSLVRVVIKLDGWFVQQQLFINLNLCFCLHIKWQSSTSLLSKAQAITTRHRYCQDCAMIFPLMLVQFWYVSCFFSYYSLCLHLFFTHEKFQQSVWLKISNTLLTITQRWIEKFSRIVRETGNTSS